MNASPWAALPGPRSFGELDSLPVESFVPFVAQRLADPAVVVSTRPRAEDARLLADYAFVVESDAPAQTAERAVFWGERYGGEGLSYNGGGVRCGLRGQHQIKGIGANPLGGQGMDYWHAHGACALRDALVDLVWGEVLSRVLPHGAVRSLAVIDTGLECFTKGDTDADKIPARRALLVREAALRPGHFERAVSYRPKVSMSAFVHDTERTRQAVARLPSALPRSRRMDSDSWQTSSPAARLSLGLEELAQRFAEQLARARARRFMHGAITSSNVCLDGRFIDFGTTSGLGCHENVVLGVNEPFWRDERHFRSILQNLCFYSGKYLPHAQLPAGLEAGVFEQIFSTRLSACLVLEFAKLSGLVFASEPEQLSPEQVALGISSIRMASVGPARGSHGIPDERHCSAFALDAAYWALASSPPEQWDRRLEACIERRDFRQQLLDHYRPARARFFGSGSPPERQTRVLKNRVLRSSKMHPWLFRHRLSEQLGLLEQRHPESPARRDQMQKFLGRLLGEVDLLHDPAATHEAEQQPTLFAGGADRLRWDLDSGDFVYESATGERCPLGQSELYRHPEARVLAAQARCFWGAGAWQSLS